METAKLFVNGRSQAVRLPKSVRFDDDVKEVTIERHGDEVTLRPHRPSWARFAEDAPAVEDDFLLNRDDLPPQDRVPLP